MPECPRMKMGSVQRSSSSSATDAPVLVLTLEGANNVLIGRCQPGDYHSLNGNYQVQQRVDTLKAILKGVGMDKNRG